MALTADREVEVSGRTELIHGIFEAEAPADIFYKGALVQINDNGCVIVAADIVDEAAIGVLKAGTRGKNAAVGEDCEIERGKIWIPFTGAAQTDVDDFFHATGDDTIARRVAQTGDPCGRCVDFKTGHLLIDFRQRLPVTAL